MSRGNVIAEEDSLPVVRFRPADDRDHRKLLADPARLMTKIDALERPDGLESLGDAPHTTADVAAELSRAMHWVSAVERDNEAMSIVNDAFISLLQTKIAREGARLGNVKPLASGGFEVQFDSHDLVGWGASVFTWWKRLRPHPFLSAPLEPEEAPEEARVALLADWGTGLYGAPECANSIASDPAGFTHVMHLGDIYYSGDVDEVRGRFSRFWPKVPGAHSRALNANHEMYTGGHAYFGQILREFRQPASYFALQNDHWLIVGLDTGYEEHDLAGDQPTWLTTLLRQAGKRKVILLTHHQPFSQTESQGARLVARLAPWLGAGRIFAWYWGHEHRCIVYDEHPRYRLHGRCIGHSGFPYFRPKQWQDSPSVQFRRIAGSHLAPSSVVLDGPNPFVQRDSDCYGPNGYVVLEIEGPHLVEIFYLADGTPCYRNTLT